MAASTSAGTRLRQRDTPAVADARQMGTGATRRGGEPSSWLCGPRPGRLCDAYRARFGPQSRADLRNTPKPRSPPPATSLPTSVSAIPSSSRCSRPANAGDYERFATLAWSRRSWLKIALADCAGPQPLHRAWPGSHAQPRAAESFENEALEITVDQTVVLSWGVIHLSLLRTRERHDEAAGPRLVRFDVDLIPESGLRFSEASLALRLAEGTGRGDPGSGDDSRQAFTRDRPSQLVAHRSSVLERPVRSARRPSARGPS